MNATKKTLTALAAAAMLAGGVSIAQTTAPAADTSTQGSATTNSQPAPSSDTNSRPMSNGTTTESSGMSNTENVAQADRG